MRKAGNERPNNNKPGLISIHLHSVSSYCASAEFTMLDQFGVNKVAGGRKTARPRFPNEGMHLVSSA